jgi:xanthine dehydrogenase molybdopterin-binding subunit B
MKYNLSILCLLFRLSTVSHGEVSNMNLQQFYWREGVLLVMTLERNIPLESDTRSFPQFITIHSVMKI